MPYFEYSKSVNDAEYYEILETLMQRWEYEIVEFKEANPARTNCPTTLTLLRRVCLYRKL